ncbi:D-2-hydroxyacid dehydrogenase [Thalassotalea piscium]
MHAVFLDQQTFSDKVSFSPIKTQVGKFTSYPLTTESQRVEHCQNADIVITNKVVIDENVLNQLPNLKLICIAATGTNNIDLVAAKKRGIAVTNVSGYSTPSVTQYVFSQILSYYSRIDSHNDNVKQGKWQQHHSFCYHGNGSNEIAGKTMTIFGYGTLGKGIAKVAKAFDMKVLIAERPNASVIREGRVSFESAIKQADILTLHCPENEQTLGLINAQIFDQMKPTAMLINTARGGIVNSLDLLSALKNKQIAYAAIDVLEQEPPSATHPLLNQSLTNISITAHVAWASFEAQQRLLNLIAINIADFQTGKMTNRLV